MAQIDPDDRLRRCVYIATGLQLAPSVRRAILEYVRTEHAEAEQEIAALRAERRVTVDPAWLAALQAAQPDLREIVNELDDIAEQWDDNVAYTKWTKDTRRHAQAVRAALLPEAEPLSAVTASPDLGYPEKNGA